MEFPPPAFISPDIIQCLSEAAQEGKKTVRRPVTSRITCPRRRHCKCLLFHCRCRLDIDLCGLSTLMPEPDQGRSRQRRAARYDTQGLSPMLQITHAKRLSQIMIQTCNFIGFGPKSYKAVSSPFNAQPRYRIVTGANLQWTSSWQSNASRGNSGPAFGTVERS